MAFSFPHKAKQELRSAVKYEEFWTRKWLLYCQIHTQLTRLSRGTCHRVKDSWRQQASDVPLPGRMSSRSCVSARTMSSMAMPVRDEQAGGRAQVAPRAAHASICAAWVRIYHQRALDEPPSNELAAKQPAARCPLLNMNQFQSPMCHFPVS